MLVVVPGAQVDRIAAAATLGQPEHLREEPETLLRLRRQQLGVREVGYVVQQWHWGPPSGRRVDGSVEQLAGSADDAGAAHQRRADGGVEVHLDLQVTGGVLDVDDM